MSAKAILNSKGIRAQAKKIASLVGTILSMKLAHDPFTHLYTRNIYHILNNVLSLNYLATLCDEALNELLFLKGLPRLGFESDIWPSPTGLSIRVATDANDFGWEGMIGPYVSRFNWLDIIWGPHIFDIYLFFSSNENIFCAMYFLMH